MSELDAFLKNQGIDEEVNDAKTAQQQAQFDMAARVAAPFLTDVGRIALNALRASTINTASANPDEAKRLGYSNFEFCFYREGQNSIVRYIETCILVAQQGPMHTIPEPQAAPIVKTTKRRR